jgi:hypothetical protein
MIEFNDNIKSVIELYKGKKKELKNALYDGLKNGLFEFEKKLIKDQLSGRKSNYGLNRVSGMASNSLNVVMSKDKNDISGKIVVGKNAWYLKLHQHYKFNGYARVHNGTCFAVPVHPQARGRWPREFNLSMIKRPGKNPILIRRVFKGGRKAGQQLKRDDIMYILTKSITIPKRLYFYEEFGTYGKRIIKENIIKNLERIKDE